MKPLRHALAVALLAVFLAPAAAADARLQPLPPPAQVNPAQAELGRHLFFETRLSGDGSRSCASCHVPAKGYADGQALSRGYNGTEYFRNAPGLLSVRLRPRLMWDGSATALVDVVRTMALDAQFMNGNADIVAERIRQIPPLFELWRKAFGPQAAPSGEGAVRSLAEYLKTLDFSGSALDAYLLGEAPLPPPADEGLRLFVGKAGCVQCHNGALLSDHKLHRLGVPEHPALLREPLRTISLLRHHAEHGLPNAMAERRDVGAYAISKDPAERGSFITPGLRGLTHTGPYMHNGRFDTLEEAVAFHLRGGGAGSELQAVDLGARERQALVAFLQALSGPLRKIVEPPAYDYGPADGGRR